jgi:UDP-N-acetylglucosamine 2-epimerase (non-hydrolysing)
LPNTRTQLETENARFVYAYLVKHACGVITDSGGITEKTIVLGVRCLTLRDNTERPKAVTVGTNELIGTDPVNLGPALVRLLAGNWKKGAIPEKWDGKAAERIVTELERLVGVQRERVSGWSAYSSL